MEVIKLEELPADRFSGTVVTIGNFDGVHLGHQAIFRRVVELARSYNVPAVAITFEPHPREVLYTGTKVPDILSFKERCQMIGNLGIAALIWVEFTLMFAARSAGSFIDELELKLKPRALVIGHDFRFGRGREGDEKFLRQRGQEKGFAVETVEALVVEGELVSSSRIRELIQEGDMEKAGLLLGQAFHMEGEVIHGHHRGKAMGFATANLSIRGQLLPPEGVYAAWAYLGDAPHPGAAPHQAVVNIGTNPTFEDVELAVEVHLLDHQGDLYKQEVRLDFVKRLRDEIKFSSAEALVEQINRDVAKARELLGRRK